MKRPVRGVRREAQELPDDLTLFRDAVKDVRPMPPHNRVEPYRAPRPPIAHKRREDEEAVLDELARLTFDDDSEFEDDGRFLRPGLPPDILRKLRRTHWKIQDELDLHGMSSGEAALALGAFLAEARRHGVRCVRVIHGKGLRSPQREPVLKRKVRKLLSRRDDVLAFVEPRAAHGGGGAVVVLLDG